VNKERVSKKPCHSSVYNCWGVVSVCHQETSGGSLVLTAGKLNNGSSKCDVTRRHITSNIPSARDVYRVSVSWEVQ
jgi:hypothetical protein